MRATGRQTRRERGGGGGRQTDRQRHRERQRHRQMQLLKRPVQSKSEVSSFATLNVYRCRGSFVAAKLQSSSRDFCYGGVIPSFHVTTSFKSKVVVAAQCTSLNSRIAIATANDRAENPSDDV